MVRGGASAAGGAAGAVSPCMLGSKAHAVARGALHSQCKRTIPLASPHMVGMLAVPAKLASRDTSTWRRTCVGCAR